MQQSTLNGHLPAPFQPSLLDLFLAFSGMAVIGFGGVLPWARRMLVEQRKWMTGDEFSEALAVAQFLPGGNILNLGVAVGQRYRGVLGSLACTAGLVVGPFILVTLLAGLYLRYGQVPAVHNMLAGIAAGAAGLMLSMAAKMARPLVNRQKLVPPRFRGPCLPRCWRLRNCRSSWCWPSWFRSVSPTHGGSCHERRRRQALDPGAQLRSPVVHRHRRRGADPAGTASAGGRGPRLDVERAIHRPLCHRAGVARTQLPCRVAYRP